MVRAVRAIGIVVLVVALTWTWAMGQGWPPRNGAALPATCATGESFFLSTTTGTSLYECTGTDTWEHVAPSSGGSLPSGFIGLVTSGSCPSGTSEVTALNGKTLFGTLAANDDVGDTGGADSLTPEGTNSTPTFTGTPFSGVINHTHGFTNLRGATTGGTTTAYGGLVAGNDTSSTLTPVETANPSGGVASITPAGTVTAPTFTGTAFDNRSAFLKVIFCAVD